jgi:hypothetical protein
MPRKAAQSAPPETPAIRPDVIVDFECADGLLSIVLKNIGAASAFTVRTRFDKPFRGVHGTVEISALALFTALEFMPPGKAFTQFVDPLTEYFARKEPIALTAAITYTDRSGRRFAEEITHDLRIYRGLGSGRLSQEEA